jgi:3-oxoacyl-[acyl-carrier protein] reductase
MDLGLRDRVAIVGGSSRGMGRAIALAFAHEGANVTICARTEADLRRAEIELARATSQQHVLAIPADLTLEPDIRRVVRDTVSRFGQINILVTHMATRVEDESTVRASELGDDVISSAIDESFLGSVRFARETIPYMKQQRWGRILNLLPEFSLHTIPVGSVKATDESALNTSNRMALTGYAKSLANELAPFNITVNNLIHGPVEGEALTAALEERSRIEGRRPDQLLQEAASLVPMGRLGRPEEVADLSVYLCSDRASYLTGANIVLDGGMRQDVR